MPSRADTQAFSRALARVSAAARADLARILAGVDVNDFAALRRALDGSWSSLVAAYGEASSSAAADVFEMWADEMGVRAQTVMVAGANPERAEARMRWAVGTPDAPGSLNVLLDELVKQPGRSTITKSSQRSGLRYARTPHGKTCAWCLMLASRGGVYHSKAGAGDLNRWHGDCDCQVVPVRGPQDYPEGYDPAALYDLYDAARQNAGSTKAKAITAELRQIAGTH